MPVTREALGTAQGKLGPQSCANPSECSGADTSISNDQPARCDSPSDPLAQVESVRGHQTVVPEPRGSCLPTSALLVL